MTTAAYIGNIKQWLDKSDIDFHAHFVRAWIPFNAWYRHEYPTISTEIDILKAVKSDGNRMRARFVQKLGDTSDEAKIIGAHIADLHKRLESDPLHDRQNDRIAFDNITSGRNPSAKHVLVKNGYSFSTEITKNGALREIACEILDKSKKTVRKDRVHGEWSDEDFQQTDFFLNISAAHQERMLECYREIRPTLKISLIADGLSSTVLKLGGVKFVSDRNLVFGGLIDVLYGMRNALFHGAVTPDTTSNYTYEPAYHLLRKLIKQVVE
jgi:hypothetical protein